MHSIEVHIDSVQKIKTALIERYKVVFTNHLSDKKTENKEISHIEVYLAQFCNMSSEEILRMKKSMTADFSKNKKLKSKK
jgi:hypothetical protein